MKNEEAYQHAKNNVELKRSFKTHLIVYVGVMLLLLIINISKSPENLWVIWPAFGWGIGLFVHGLKAFVFKSNNTITEEIIREEIEENDYV
ncbi:MAG: hypothetical protein DWQ02_05620 [Bacteroidetes bacterium]|nr:MAG: hypothetical protein DWQ02_05620 [Bacteroidota bacterium]